MVSPVFTTGTFVATDSAETLPSPGRVEEFPFSDLAAPDEGYLSIVNPAVAKSS